MKIKFLKEYKFLRGFDNDIKLTTTKIFKDAIIDTAEDEIPDDDVQWLIDNGFAKKVAEEVKESGRWKPKFDEKYCFVDGCGKVGVNPWCNDELDECRYSVGNIFKTEELAQAYTNYLKAVATVSQDKGFMKEGECDWGYPIYKGEVLHYKGGALHVEDFPLFVEDSPVRAYANTLYFDTREHAIASLQNHRKEWETICAYKWGKG